MARPKNHVPSYCWHKSANLGYARFQGRNGPPTYFPGPYGSDQSKKAYDINLRHWLENNRQPPTQSAIPPNGSVSAGQLANRFWDYVEDQGAYCKNGKPTSERHDLRAAFRVLLELYTDTDTADFGLAEMDALRRAMVARGWAESTVKKHMQRIRSLFAWGQDHKLVPESVRLVPRKGLAKGVRVKGRATERRRPPDPFAVGAVQLCACLSARAMIWLQFLNGMRSAGVCYLRPCDLDCSRPVWVYAEPPHLAAKTGGERHWLGPRAQAILQPFLDAAPTPTSRVFRTEARPGANTSGGWAVSYYRRYIANLCEHLGVEHWSPHQLRHAHGVRVEDLYGREAAQKRLGHSSPQTTAIYTPTAVAILERIAKEIG